MARGAWRLGLGLACGGLASWACSGADVFACSTDAECVDGEHAGQCQAEGYCSFPDPACPSGQRFGAHAGPLANTCVDAGTGTDAPLASSSSTGPTPATTSLPAGDTSTSSLSGDPEPPVASTGPVVEPGTGSGSTTEPLPPDDPYYQPCDGRCPYPCLEVIILPWSLCSEPCDAESPCAPWVDPFGEAFEPVCTMPFGAAMETCMIPCNGNADCPAGASCEPPFGFGDSVCLFPR